MRTQGMVAAMFLIPGSTQGCVLGACTPLDHLPVPWSGDMAVRSLPWPSSAWVLWDSWVRVITHFEQPYYRYSDSSKRALCLIADLGG